jgi:hypothetical protein
MINNKIFMRGCFIMIQEGSTVSGINMDGNSINGTVSNVLRSFGVAIVKTGSDRTNVCQCYMRDLEEQK